MNETPTDPTGQPLVPDADSPRHLRWWSYERSHVGMVRKVNEDACLALSERGLWAVADGMGGHEAGDIASQSIIDMLRRIPPPLDWETFIAEVRACLIESNRQLREESAQRYSSRTIGSTVVVLLAYEDQGACLWVGDSRLYRLREGRLELLSRDHSHVQELVDQGLIRPEEAHEHPLGNVITRAVGSADELEVDMIDFPLLPGDVFLLCSDGLNKVIDDSEIAHFLSLDDLEQSVQVLIRQSLVRGATDNVTVVAVGVAEAAPGREVE